MFFQDDDGVLAKDNFSSLYVRTRYFAYSIDEEGILNMMRKKDKRSFFMSQSFDELLKMKETMTLLKLRWLNKIRLNQEIQIHLRGRT
jgi:hypothetical protein